MSNVILKRCPFCGEWPDFETAECANGTLLVFVLCPYCKARTAAARLHDSMNNDDRGFVDAATKWNHRVAEVNEE